MTKEDILNLVRANENDKLNLELFKEAVSDTSKIDIQTIIGSKENTLEFIETFIEEDLTVLTNGTLYKIKNYRLG